MFKVNNKEARTTSTVTLFLTLSLTLRILVSLLLTLNIFHILHDVKNAEIRALYWNKERKLRLTDYKLKCFSSRIKPPHRPPPHRLYKPSHKYRPIKFVFCPYILPGRINGILRYLKNKKSF